MCIIASSEIGKALPTNETIRTMWFKNSDGAGFMFNKDGKVIIRKGFMKLEDFMTAIEELKNEIDVVNTTVIMHFRIGTHGGNIPENTHPFPVVSVESMLKKLTMTCDIGMAHNGIINSVKPRAGISDTMEYDLEILANLKKLTPDFHKHKVCQTLIEETINGSRMCFLTPDGEVTYIGDWHTDEEGIKYSNTGFRTYKDDLYWYESRNSYKGYGSNWKTYTADSYRVDEIPELELWDLAKEVIVAPLTEGYVVDGEGTMMDCNEDEFYIDEIGYIYIFDYEYEILIRMDDMTAYTTANMPAKISEDDVLDMMWYVSEREYDKFAGIVDNI